MILFDATPTTFRAVAYTNDFEELSRLEISTGPASAFQRLPERVYLGAIDGFFRRHAYWRRRRIFCVIACVDAQGNQWRELRALYRKYDKPCPWRLRHPTIPDHIRQEVALTDVPHRHRSP